MWLQIHRETQGNKAECDRLGHLTSSDFCTTWHTCVCSYIADTMGQGGVVKGQKNTASFDLLRHTTYNIADEF